MATAVWTLILQNFLAALGAIDGTGDYNHKLRSIQLWRSGGFPWKGDYPEAAVYDGRKTVQDWYGTPAFAYWDRLVTVEMVDKIQISKEGTEYSEEVEKQFDDIIASVMADPTRGGNAINTVINEASPVLYKEKTTVGVTVVFAVRYGHRFDNGTIKR